MESSEGDGGSGGEQWRGTPMANALTPYSVFVTRSATSTPSKCPNYLFPCSSAIAYKQAQQRGRLSCLT